MENNAKPFIFFVLVCTFSVAGFIHNCTCTQYFVHVASGMIPPSDV